ncbi:MAG: MSMEG_1061 family FMN-dependent PPOX-type flavoprotein [Pseudomonadota bacterium]
MADKFTLDTLDDVLAHYDQPPAPASLAKVADHLTPAYRAWLEPVKFAVLATAGANGIDCSPRGDSEPLFTIEDDRTLLMPDWYGNNRLDTLRNIVSIPAIGIICLLPGVGECLRIGGTATISIDPKLLERFERDEKSPRSVVTVDISRVYFQCARALIRSGLWSGDSDAHSVPTAGQMTKSASGDFDADSYDAALRPRQLKTLW